MDFFIIYDQFVLMCFGGGRGGKVLVYDEFFLF